MKWFLFSTAESKSLLFNLGLLVLRVTCGLSMAFGHGLSKMPPSDKFIEGVTEMGFPSPEIFAWLAGLSEFLGGLCIAIGLFVRPSALFLAFTMAVAAFVRHAPDPFKVKELSVLYFALSVSLLLIGGGSFALDRFFRKK